MTNVTHDEAESTSASLAANSLKMPSWLLEMTEYIYTYIYIALFYVLLIYTLHLSWDWHECDNIIDLFISLYIIYPCWLSPLILASCPLLLATWKGSTGVTMPNRCGWKRFWSMTSIVLRRSLSKMTWRKIYNMCNYIVTPLFKSRDAAEYR